jgi:hypothetical protein
VQRTRLRGDLCGGSGVGEGAEERRLRFNRLGLPAVVAKDTARDWKFRTKHK